MPLAREVLVLLEEHAANDHLQQRPQRAIERQHEGYVADAQRLVEVVDVECTAHETHCPQEVELNNRDFEIATEDGRLKDNRRALCKERRIASEDGARRGQLHRGQEVILLVALSGPTIIIGENRDDSRRGDGADDREQLAGETHGEGRSGPQSVRPGAENQDPPVAYDERATARHHHGRYLFPRPILGDEEREKYVQRPQANGQAVRRHAEAYPAQEAAHAMEAECEQPLPVEPKRLDVATVIAFLHGRVASTTRNNSVPVGPRA
mmetsp:Transcript_119185/g.337158  ORF Transcript_119185/g.337158 Transcript_119185/m.337158 type:complete len:266 (-) Transcript_119185:53-850(-)